jgi:hypothetical protein
MKKNSILTLLLVLATGSFSWAQKDSVIEELKQQNQILSEQINRLKPGKNQFRVTGFTNLTYHQDLEDPNVSRFDHAGFSPIFIWRPSEKLFFESELHVELEGGVHGGEVGEGHGGDGEGGGHAGSAPFDLGYANMGYFLNDYVTITAGKFLSPLGTFNERFHPTWINQLPTNPLGMGHGGPLPSSELGLQFRGGLPLGKMKMNYSLYLSNGPILEDGLGDPERAGSLIFSNFKDNNANKALGGRFGFLPLSNSSLEIGLSGQWAAKVGDAGGAYEDIGAITYVGDFSYIKDYSSIYGSIRLTGQFSNVRVDDATYVNDSTDIMEGEDSLYTFKNTSTFYYAQISYRPTKVENKIVKNMEIAFRYAGADLAPGSKWAYDNKRMTIGLNYWLHPRSVVKIAFEIGEFNDVAYLQWALGF